MAVLGVAKSESRVFSGKMVQGLGRCRRRGLDFWRSLTWRVVWRCGGGMGAETTGRVVGEFALRVGFEGGGS